jgi:glycosyltransferase involved in cell wall biosynthesis
MPAFNESKLVQRAVHAARAALEAMGPRGHGCEVIVCDNASTDGTADLAREAGASVVQEPVRQIARARNRGAAAARGEWLVFIDADSTPSPALFTELLKAISDPGCLGGGALISLESAPLGGRILTEVWNVISRITHWAPGSFLFCRAEAFREVGGFNEELFVSEELDLSRRLKRLAKQRGQQFVILARERLVTSARKLELYSPREALGFSLRYLRNPRRIARQREACPIWYDGRR